MNGGNCRPNPTYIICYKSVPAQLKHAWYFFFIHVLRCLVVLSSSQRMKESLNESLAFQAPLFKLNNNIYIDIQYLHPKHTQNLVLHVGTGFYKC